MIAVTYHINLQEPLLVTALSGEPNSAVALPYVPGSTIRGVVAGYWQSRHPHDDLTSQARTLLFSGLTRYLNAYLVDGQNQRRLPAPLSWRKEKGARSGHGDIEDYACMSPEESKLKQPESIEGFASVHDDEVSLATPSRNITVHILRDRFAGRPTESQGAVYRYEALAVEQRFAGVIIAPTKDVAKQLQDILKPGYYKLGGAATAGYGQVVFEDIQINDNWHETSIRASAIAEGTEFVVTLLSDAILRDANGATTTDLPQALDLPVTEVRSFKKAMPVGGFNRTWGLPLPQAWAVRAGSVYVLKAMAPVSRDIIEKLMIAGVGERKAEGFGRLVINWQQESNLRDIPTSEWSPQSGQVILSGDSVILARRMMIRRQRQDLDRELVKAIQRLPIRNAPSNNQLARVRILVRSALGERDLARVVELFTEELSPKGGKSVKDPRALKANALKKFQAARVGKNRLGDWIGDLASNPGRVWEMLTQRPAVALGGVSIEEEYSEELAREYAARLIDGVLGQAMSKGRSEGRAATGPALPSVHGDDRTPTATTQDGGIS